MHILVRLYAHSQVLSPLPVLSEEEPHLDPIPVFDVERLLQMNWSDQLKDILRITRHEWEDNTAWITAGYRSVADQTVAETLCFGKNPFTAPHLEGLLNRRILDINVEGAAIGGEPENPYYLAVHPRNGEKGRGLAKSGDHSAGDLKTLSLLPCCAYAPTTHWNAIPRPGKRSSCSFPLLFPQKFTSFAPGQPSYRPPHPIS
jgi:hypothetical protein